MMNINNSSFLYATMWHETSGSKETTNVRYPGRHHWVLWLQEGFLCHSDFVGSFKCLLLATLCSHPISFILKNVKKKKDKLSGHFLHNINSWDYLLKCKNFPD
jgi:hypothetical protein